MSANDIATWGGVVLTLVSLALPFVLHQRRGVSVFIQKWTKIVDDVTSTIEGLEVSYNGDKDVRNLVRITGFVQNSGRSDIDKNDVYDPLTITLPGESRWLQANFVSDGPKGSARLDGAKLSFDWDLLRRGERIRFEALFQYLPPGGNRMAIEDIFISNGRIKNTPVRTLRELDVAQRPILGFGTLIAGIWLVWLVGNFVELFGPVSADYGLFSGDRAVTPYVASDGRLCASQNYNIWWQVLPFSQPPPCDVELQVFSASLGEFEYRVERNPPNDWWRFLFFGAIVAYWAWSMADTLVRRYSTQKRHFGSVRWLRLK